MSIFRFDDPEQYVSGTPFDEFKRLRNSAPIIWCDGSDTAEEGYWLITRYDDVVAISKNPQLFSSYAPLLGDPIPKDLWSSSPALAMIADNLMTFDYNRHPHFRSIINQFFSAERVSVAQNDLEVICMNLLARATSAPTFDFAASAALPIATEAILRYYLGVPKEDLATLSASILTINAMDDPFFRPRRESLLDAAETLFDYGQQLLRRTTKDNVASGILPHIVSYAQSHDIAPDQLFFAYWFPLAAGAFDTSAATIAGGVKILIEMPAELTKLKSRPDMLQQAISEIIRWVSPVIYFRRTATENTHVHGKLVRKGQKVVLCYASANRDEAVFENPDEFSIERRPNNHLSFGHGPHYCLGARLASTLLNSFFSNWLSSPLLLELDGPVIHTRSAWMNRIRQMPVRIINFGQT